MTKVKDVRQRVAFLIFPFITVIGLDQFSKYWVRTNPTLQQLDIVEGVFEFTYTLNDGMAMGIDWLPTKVISIVAILATIAIMIYAISTWKTSTKLYLFCISAILGGAVGNIIDRIFMGIILGHGGVLEGHVVDFLYFSLKIGDWAVFPYIFNVADVAISGAIIILLLFSKWAFNDISEEEQSEQKISDEASSI